MRDDLPDSVQVPQAAPANALDRLDAAQWLAALVASSDDAILGKSLTGVITTWNAGATRIFGYEAEEAIGKPVSFLAWPGEEVAIEGFLERLRRGDRVDHFEVARKHKSGKKIFVSLSLSPIVDSDGTITGLPKSLATSRNERPRRRRWR